MKKETYVEDIVAKIKQNKTGNIVKNPMEIISIFSLVPDNMKEEVYKGVEEKLNEG